jgi:hypothetical protein
LVLWQARSLIFLDKVCIHQTDPVKKRKGIDGLGGFLRCSSQMVIFWDGTYFDRLWCTFELAAFTYLNGKVADIPFVPVMRGAAMLTVVMFSTIFYAVSITPWLQQANIIVAIINGLLLLIIGLVGTNVGRHYARDLRNMRDQIQGFKLKQANCTCCEWNHINPFTNEPMQCDRVVVEDAVKEWFPGGLSEFDQHVRDDMYQKIVGRVPALMSYRELVLASLPTVWFEMCKLGVDCFTFDLLIRRLAFLGFYWFAFNPFVIALLLRIAAFARKKQTSWQGEVAVTCLVSLAWAVIYIFVSWVHMSIFWHVLTILSYTGVTFTADAPRIVLGGLINTCIFLPMAIMLLRMPESLRRKKNRLSRISTNSSGSSEDDPTVSTRSSPCEELTPPSSERNEITMV